MIKAILIDLDGVIIHRKQFFSELLAQNTGLSIQEDILPFFKSDFKDCMLGKKNLRDMLPAWLEKWGWEGDIDSFLKFWFESERDIDESMLLHIRSLREAGIKIYLATDNEINRLNYVLDDLGLRAEFDGVFGSAVVGSKKESLDYWHFVFNALQIEASEVLFIDDDSKNTELAKSLGVNIITYSKEINLQSEFNNFGIK